MRLLRPYLRKNVKRDSVVFFSTDVLPLFFHFFKKIFYMCKDLIGECFSGFYRHVYVFWILQANIISKVRSEKHEKKIAFIERFFIEVTFSPIWEN